MSSNTSSQPTGRVTADSKNATKYLTEPFLEWASQRGISFPAAPSEAVVLLYMMERAAGTWKPARSKADGGLKHESLRKIPSALADHYKSLGHSVDHLVDNAAISNLIRNFKNRLPTNKVAKSRALPLIERRLDTIEAFLRSLVDARLIHLLWALRWIAALRTAYAAALRPSEVVRIRIQWITRAMTTGGPGYLITIPYSKHHDEPRPTCLSPALPGGAKAASAVDEWMTEARRCGYSFKANDLLFPVVIPGQSRRQRGWNPVKGRKLSEFPHLVAELATTIDPSVTVAGSNMEVRWRCKLGHRWTARISRRTARGTGCPECWKIRNSLGNVPHPDDEPEFKNLISGRLANPDVHPDDTLAIRMGRAVAYAAGEQSKTYRAICRAAGLQPRNGFENLGANGPRRGSTVDLTQAGFDPHTIAKHLRHAHPSVTSPYIEEADLDPPTAVSGLPGWDE